MIFTANIIDYLKLMILQTGRNSYKNDREGGGGGVEGWERSAALKT